MTFHDETGLWLKRDRDAIWVVIWDYYESLNDDEGGGGGHEWRDNESEALEAFGWACVGWQRNRCTVRLVKVLAPSGMQWTEDRDLITTAVMGASDLFEEPSKYPPHFSLVAECKWNGGAS